MQKYEGYPSGSMVDYACDLDGFPILAISSLATHTKVGIQILYGIHILVRYYQKNIVYSCVTLELYDAFFACLSQQPLRNAESYEIVMIKSNLFCFVYDVELSVSLYSSERH